MLEVIKHDETLLAYILRAGFNTPGISFVTPDELTLQLAYMQHPNGKKILPHRHNPVPRDVLYTYEVLVIKKGKLRVDFYTREEEYLHSRVLYSGDTILLTDSAHGFEVLEAVEMLEIKQGPFVGDSEKTRFEPHYAFQPCIVA
ncbi:hypothetical protein [Teredinibacter waterburyi]|jgi:hypothetical protein|uniref:hypothetical protein n=1 Tax=Teredinibacter waterburyi TaxID=1500538 RepID=UPI00165FE78D|nr:hypothetical protein [Teredinibacter waterburyi]